MLCNVHAHDISKVIDKFRQVRARVVTLKREGCLDVCCLQPRQLSRVSRDNDTPMVAVRFYQLSGSRCSNRENTMVNFFQTSQKCPYSHLVSARSGCRSWNSASVWKILVVGQLHADGRATTQNIAAATRSKSGVLHTARQSGSLSKHLFRVLEPYIW